jgi:hypothetical protein
MGVIEQIEAEIEKLDAKAFAELRDWFLDHMHARWDEQIEADAAAGRLDFLAEEAQDAERGGSTRPL